MTPSDTHNSSPEAKDKLTILRPKVFTGKRLVHTPDGIHKEPAANAKTFRRLTREVAGVDDLYTLLHEGRDEILIHGAALPDTPSVHCERRNEFFADQALRTIVLDIDGFKTNARALDEAAKEYRALLPVEFRDASCVAQASSGFNTKEGQQSFRLFFFASEPVTENQKSAWLIAPDTLPKTVRKRKDGKEVEVSTLDPSIWRRVQPIYVANPIVEGGADPCPERWSLIDGKPCVSVPDVLPEPVCKTGKARGLAAPEGVTIDDPDALGDAIEKLATRRLEHASNSRHLSIVYAGADFSDYGISPELAEAVTLAWAMPDEDHAEMLRDMLTDRGFSAADAQRKLARIAEIREALAAEHEGENPFAETDDFTVSEIAVKLEEGYRSARNGFGAKVATAGGKAFDSIAEADGMLPERQERKRQKKAELTTRQRFATFEQGALFTGDDDIFGEPDALPAVSGPMLLAALEGDARFADDAEALLAAHRAVNAIIREPQVADTAERLAQLRALVDDGELPARAETKKAPSVRRFAIASDLARDWRPTRYVVNKWIPEGEVGFMFGPSKSRKSFVAMDIAAHVVCGRPWRDWETKRGGVIYWATEGAGGVAGRFKAWLAEYAARYGLDDELRVAVVTDRLDLKTKEGRRPLREMIGDYNATFRDLPCGLVFIDTWNKAVRLETGQDIELSPIISELESLARKNATTICALGHPGKDLSRGMKGSIVYETDATFRMKVVKERSGLTKIEIDKQKEGEDGICELIAFRPHNLGEDDFGRMATSLAAVPKGDAFEAVAEDRDGAGAFGAASDVSLLQAIEAGGYTFTTLATAAGLRSKGSVSERLDRLADEKLVKALGGGKFSLTRKGRQKVTDWRAALENADADYEALDDDDA
ncbi:MAG: AAA family ATPase [Methylocystis sp.]